MKIMIELEAPEVERCLQLVAQIWGATAAPPVPPSVDAAIEPVTLPSPPPKSSSAERLPFDEFDQLCKAELARLALDRRVPGYKLWDQERDRRLPTMMGVLSRYKVTTLAALAHKVGLLPPLSAEKGVSHEG